MFFKAKSVQQVAVLPFIAAAEVEVLMITTRNRGGWIVPKGWPVKGMTFTESAATEAREEAGILGLVDDAPVGDYSYGKEMDAGYTVRCHVFVYPMLVQEHRLEWPEQDERKFRWCGLETAAELTDEPGLELLFAELAETDGAALQTFAAPYADMATSPPRVSHITQGAGKESFAS